MTQREVREKETMTGWEIMKEMEELEPKNFIDYILKGSALTQFLKKHNISPYKSKLSKRSKEE